MGESIDWMRSWEAILTVGALLELFDIKRSVKAESAISGVK